MTRIAPMRPPYQKAKAPRADKKHLARVAELPCVVCHEFSLPQNSPTQVHHCIHGRYGTRRAPDSMTIPLGEGHHQGMFDTSKVALHREPTEWKRLYGEDTGWISWVEERLSSRGQKFVIRGECRAPECGERESHSGYCDPHYRRNLKYGTPTGGGAMRGQPLKWLKDNACHSGDDCLPWPFSKKQGYYSISLGDGKWTKAHRKMCEIANGPPSAGMVAMHLCHNKSCVNPKHLKWGTPKENSDGSVACGLMLKGEKMPTSRLTDSMVGEIRERWGQGESLDSITADYPVSRSAIWFAATGKTWKHIK